MPFSFRKKKITSHPTLYTHFVDFTPSTQNCVLFNTFFSRVGTLIWHRKFCPIPPTTLWQLLSYTFLFSFDFFFAILFLLLLQLIPKSNARTHTTVYRNTYTCSPKCTYTGYILLKAIRNTITCKGILKYFSLLGAGEVLIHNNKWFIPLYFAWFHRRTHWEWLFWSLSSLCGSSKNSFIIISLENWKIYGCS